MTCATVEGQRVCGDCPAGTGAGTTGCVDINECGAPISQGGCDPLVPCTNVDGSRQCGACPAGYSGSGDTGCVDINECETDRGGCDRRTTCSNLPGTRQCSACPVGFSGTGDTSCTDINECLTNNGGCFVDGNVQSQCTNRIGSRACGPCPSGYTGNGITCTEIQDVRQITAAAIQKSRVSKRQEAEIPVRMARRDTRALDISRRAGARTSTNAKTATTADVPLACPCARMWRARACAVHAPWDTRLRHALRGYQRVHDQ